MLAEASRKPREPKGGLRCRCPPQGRTGHRHRRRGRTDHHSGRARFRSRHAALPPRRHRRARCAASAGPVAPKADGAAAGAGVSAPRRRPRPAPRRAGRPARGPPTAAPRGGQGHQPAGHGDRSRAPGHRRHHGKPAAAGAGMVISHSGVFKGEVQVEDAEIAGTFDGTLIANGSLTIRATGACSAQPQPPPVGRGWRPALRQDGMITEASAPRRARRSPRPLERTRRRLIPSRRPRGRAPPGKDRRPRCTACVRLACCHCCCSAARRRGRRSGPWRWNRRCDRPAPGSPCRHPARRAGQRPRRPGPGRASRRPRPLRLWASAPRMSAAARRTGAPSPGKARPRSGSTRPRTAVSMSSSTRGRRAAGGPCGSPRAWRGARHGSRLPLHDPGAHALRTAS